MLQVRSDRLDRAVLGLAEGVGQVCGPRLKDDSEGDVEDERPDRHADDKNHHPGRVDGRSGGLAPTSSNRHGRGS